MFFLDSVAFDLASANETSGKEPMPANVGLPVEGLVYLNSQDFAPLFLI